MRKLHNEGLFTLYVSPYITKAITPRKKKIGEIRDTHGEKRNAQSVLAVKPEEKKTLEGPRRRFCKKKMVSKKTDGRAWTGFLRLRTGQGSGS